MSTPTSGQPSDAHASDALEQQYSTPPEMKLEDRRRNYRSYLRATRDADCLWMDSFFDHPPQIDQPQGQVTAYISDGSPWPLRTRYLGPGDEEQVADIVASKNLRAIILTYSHTCLLGRPWVEILASAFNISPAFLRRHLDYPRRLERERPLASTHVHVHETYPKALPSAGHLPSETSSTTFEIGRYPNYMSAWLHGDELAPNYYDDVHNSVLTNFSDWKQFLAPYVRLLLMEYQSHIAYEVELLVSSRRPGPTDPGRHGSTKVEFRFMLDMRMDLEAFRRTLANFIAADKTQAESTLQLKALLDDCDQLLLRLEQAIKTYSQLHKNEVLAEQLQETRESKQASISVNRLTKLAFVFIPLNFICALFSANLLILGDGVSLWVFAVAAVVAVTLTILPVLGSIISYIRTAWASIKRNILRHVWYALYLAWHSPRAGVYYALFCLSHDADTNVMLWRKVYIFRWRWDRISDLLTFEFIPDHGRAEDKMWKRRIQIINDLLGDPNGHKRRFWHSWPGFSPKEQSRPSTPS
ncbi:uncharacterized protein EI97DRAFT_445591 [Westerdykella ornata]|uniref:Uncharacterized protein n=1 Tax=Westerdykella ornata TaxID=318751 RepID=A0A6A6J8T1_WESOR|nr:uncharacterized protein EI97DRAFT_445591 [Westerdykella ornata]KAF2272667.1 hypothetical protein EI97DRAFT_445591 [Westerdykella ornata]